MHSNPLAMTIKIHIFMIKSNDLSFKYKRHLEEFQDFFTQIKQLQKKHKNPLHKAYPISMYPKNSSGVLFSIFLLIVHMLFSKDFLGCVFLSLGFILAIIQGQLQIEPSLHNYIKIKKTIQTRNLESLYF